MLSWVCSDGKRRRHHHEYKNLVNCSPTPSLNLQTLTIITSHLRQFFFPESYVEPNTDTNEGQTQISALELLLGMIEFLEYEFIEHYLTFLNRCIT